MAKIENKEYDVWLPENHPGSKRVQVGDFWLFDLNESNPKANGYPKKKLKLTEKEVAHFKSYGFKMRELSSKSEPKSETVKKEKEK